MIYRALFFLCFLVKPIVQVYAQSDKPKPTSYRDFVIDGNQVWLLTSKGTIKVGSLKSSGYTDSIIDTDAPVVALAIDKKRNIVLGDTNHIIKSYDYHKKSWRTIGQYTNKLTSIIFNSQNQCFLVTNRGINAVEKSQTYLPKDSFSKNSQIKYKKGWFQAPTCFIDHQDNLWLGFDHGEWGGDVFVFDTRQKRFNQLETDIIKMTMNPVNGFCEAQHRVYMSGGLSHMSLTHGSVVKFTNNVAYTLLESKDVETPIKVVRDTLTGKEEKWTTWAGGHRIGPVAYNSSDNCLYFYSQKGIFKGDVNATLRDINQWQNILKPNLKWSGGRTNAVGSPMNVLKMNFTKDGALVFLAEYDGLGIYDGKSLRFIN